MLEKLESSKIDQTDIGFCLVPSKIINETSIENKSEGEIGVYIPKIMTHIDMKDEPYIKEELITKQNVIKNSNYNIKFPNKIKVCNFVRVEPLKSSNLKHVILAPSEKCTIQYINNDIKLPKYSRDNTQEEKREKDIYEIYVPNMDKEDYSLILDSINERFSLYLSENNNIDMNDELSKLIINMKNDIKLNSKEFNVDSDNILFNTSKFEINGERIESMIRRIVQEVCKGCD